MKIVWIIIIIIYYYYVYNDHDKRVTRYYSNMCVKTVQIETQ